MTLTNAENIEDFCAYFRRQVTAIARVTIAPPSGDVDSGAGSEFLYRKVLWVSAIDTLAGLRYNVRHNRERFMQFVEEHGSWPEGALVSIPFTGQTRNIGATAMSSRAVRDGKAERILR